MRFYNVQWKCIYYIFFFIFSLSSFFSFLFLFFFNLLLGRKHYMMQLRELVSARGKPTTIHRLLKICSCKRHAARTGLELTATALLGGSFAHFRHYCYISVNVSQEYLCACIMMTQYAFFRWMTTSGPNE